jgi:hypothetical protein
MDCDEALGLLKGGQKAVEEWNRWRGSGEEIPTLLADHHRVLS